MLAFHFSALSVKTFFSLCSPPLIKIHLLLCLHFLLSKSWKLLETGSSWKKLEVKAFTFHSVIARAAGRNVAVKFVCLKPVDSALGMELMENSSKGAGSTFWQLVVRQEPRDELHKEPGPAAAAVGGRCLEALLLRPLCWILGPAAVMRQSKERWKGVCRVWGQTLRSRRLGEDVL